MGGNWQEVKLEEIIEIIHGYGFKGKYFSDKPTEDILLTPGNFAVGGGFKDDKLKYYDGPVDDEFILQAGDLILTMTDLSKASDTLGYPALVPESDFFRYLHNQRLGKVIILNPETVDKKFLYFRMRDYDYRWQVVASATGTTVKHTSPSRILNIPIALPPLPTQQRIAHILGTLDDKIELNRRMNDTLEGIARAIFKSWFVDFDPVRAKLDGRDPGLPQDIADLFPNGFEDSDLGKIPRGWGVSTIEDEIEAVGGGTPSTKNPKYWNGGKHHFATPKDLSGLSSPILLETERKVTDAGLEKISSGLLPVGTLLMSSRAPVGYLAIAKIPVCVNQGFIAMKCNVVVSNYYVLNWAKENMYAIQARASGTTFAEISKRNFKPMPIIVPSNEIIQAFDKNIEPIYQKITVNLKEAQTLADLRNTMLPKLMRGELRV